MRPMKVHPTERANIARAYWAGVAPSELSRQHEISPPLVIQIAQKWERNRLERRQKMRRTLPPPTVMYAWKSRRPDNPTIIDRGKVVTRPDGQRVYETRINGGMPVTLPYVSILGLK